MQDIQLSTSSTDQTKKASKYEAKADKSRQDTYINTAGKKGTKYYYKAKALVYERR